MQTPVRAISASILLLAVVYASLPASVGVASPALQPTTAAEEQLPTRTSAVSFEQTGIAGAHAKLDKGLLTVHAENSTWSDVLRAVETATGAAIDSPAVATGRVSLNLGPGKPLDVLTALLNDSPYDYYIVLGAQPQLVSRITLAMRGDGARISSSSEAGRDPGRQPAPREQKDKALDAQQLKEVQRQQDLEWQRQFGACIAQGCDRS